MAFTVTARHTIAPTTSNATSRSSASTTPTADSLLIVVGCGEEDNRSGPTTLNAPSGGGLTYTQIQKVDGAGAPNWASSESYQLLAGLWTAPVGGSPSAFALTQSTSAISFICAAACDVTGHNSTTPVVQSKSASAAINPASSTASGTITVDAGFTAGNLIVVAFAAGADTGGGFATPTAGAGKSFTAAVNQNGGYAQCSWWYRVADGTESATITCSDLGESVGNYVAFAMEIAAASGGGATVELAHLSATATTHQPAVTTGAVTVALNHLSAAATLPSPSVTQTVALTHLGAGGTLHQPAVTAGAVTATLEHLNATATLHQPAVSVGATTVELDHLSTPATAHEPAVSAGTTVALQHLSAAATGHDPAVTTGAVTVSMTALSSPADLHEPAVATTGQVVLPHLSAAVTAPSPAVTYAVALDHLTSAATLHQSAVATGTAVVLPTLDAPATLHQPAVGPGAVTVTIPALSATVTVHAPSVAQAVALQLITAAATLHLPSVTVGSVSVDLPHLSAAVSTHSPTVVLGELIVIRSPRILVRENASAVSVRPSAGAIVVDS